MSKAENIKGKKVAVFNSCAGPIQDSRKTYDILKDDLDNLGFITTDHFISIKMKKLKMLDGKQNIDDFVSKIIS
jgi:hypothetical protein